MVLKKLKANSQCWNIKNFKHRSEKEMYYPKNDQKLWLMQKPNEKFISFVIILLWEVIYAHFYNWDCPLDLVLVVYDLIELIIKISLWSKDYSTFDTHTQHTSLISNEYLFHLCDCTCSNVMCVCSTICGSNQKDFCSFCLLLEVICITHVFQNFSNFFCVKNMFSRYFCDLFHV